MRTYLRSTFKHWTRNWFTFWNKIARERVCSPCKVTCMSEGGYVICSRIKELDHSINIRVDMKYGKDRTAQRLECSIGRNSTRGSSVTRDSAASFKATSSSRNLFKCHCTRVSLISSLFITNRRCTVDGCLALVEIIRWILPPQVYITI